MSLAEMLSDLPKHCAVGTKRNAKGHTSSWIGYKLHLNVADDDPRCTSLRLARRQPQGNPPPDSTVAFDSGLLAWGDPD
jgi:hypothetical protein